MSTSPGSRLDHYEILESIGKGGMGEVFRARDTRLPRYTAIKTSQRRFSERFAHEAQVIAALNHPNISTLYDIGPDYLVMEFVEGMTLADRIKEGPLQLEEASTIARQIADALDYAHERGVVHRDLKPGNVKIRPDGVVKVLDFGLAKTGASPTSESAEMPTMAGPQTDAGMILGTAAYMSPEQTRGKGVDKRTDIWAFGCVFYEMLTGAPPLQGDTSQETMASILRDEPDLEKVPAQARRLLKRCLEKDPQKRLRHIGDVMALLDEPPSGLHAPPVAQSDVRPAAAVSTGRKNWLWPAIAAGAVVIAGAVLIVRPPGRTQTTAGQAVRFEVGESDTMKFFYGGAIAVSPDGHWLVFPAKSDDGVNRYWLRSLDTVEARALPGTETAYVPAAWAADSRHVLFSPLSTAQIRQVDIQGGPPQVVSDMVGRLNGVTANKDGVILFGTSEPRSPIFRVAGAGRAPVPVTSLARGESSHRYPQFLPDGRHFLYFKASLDPNLIGAYIGSVDSKPEEQNSRRVLASNRQAYYAASPAGNLGHLIFLRDTTLLAQPFDVTRMELSSEGVPIAEGVESFPSQSYGLFSVSDSGTLVYGGGAGAKLSLTWLDEKGSTAGAFASGDYSNPAVSPDQSRVAVALGPAGSRDIWTVDVASGTTTRLTFDPANDDNPVWSPDGKNVAFASNRSGQQKLYLKPADGSGEERLLTDKMGAPTSWSKDGRFLLFTSVGEKTSDDIWALPDPGRPSSAAGPFAVLATPLSESQAQFSPDGRWIAYVSIESGQRFIYVRPFSPEGTVSANGAKWLVSDGFSLFPRWRADGRRLFYVRFSTLDVVSVDVDTSKGFQAGTPKRVLSAPPPLLPVGWSPSADGKRFLFITTPQGGRLAPFTVVVNWAAALKK